MLLSAREVAEKGQAVGRTGRVFSEAKPPEAPVLQTLTRTGGSSVVCVACVPVRLSASSASN